MLFRERRIYGVAAAAFAGLILAGCGDSGAEQQKLAAEITKGVEDYLALVETPNQPFRIHHDKVAVTPAEDGKSFLVAITGLRYGSDTVARATFGEVDYRLTPQDKDLYQVSDLKIAKEVPILNADGKPEASVKFETTAFSGIWSKPLQNFLKLDWQLKDISASATDRPGEVFHIATAAMTSDGKEGGKGLLDQVATVVISGLSASDPADGTNIKMDKLTGHVTVAGLDFPGYRQMMAKLNALTPKFQAPLPEASGAAPAVPGVSEDDRKALADLVRGIPKLMSAYAYDFSAEGLTVVDGSQKTLVQLGQGGIGLGLKGINTDHAELSFGIKHDGLVLNGPAYEDPMVKAVLPKSGNLSLVATDLPLPSLLEGVAQSLPVLTSADPETAQGGQIMMMGALMSALSQSKIKLRIDPSALKTERASLSADGELRLAMETPEKAVGAINLVLVGLDDLIALATEQAQQSPIANQAMAILPMIQSFAQRETGADGKPVDKFKVDMTETGSVLVNGKSLEGMAP